MTSRQRVLTALDHAQPDRVPVFAPNLIRTREPYDPRLLEFLDTFDFDDFAHVAGLVDPPSRMRELANETFVDGYGCRFKYMGVGLPYCTHHALAGAETVADVEAFDWPDPDAPGLITPDAAEKARQLRQPNGRVRAVVVAPLFHQYHYLRGFEQWMLDVKLHRGVHEAIARRIAHINSTLLVRLLEQVGPAADLVCTGDDFGTSTATYMSPDDFRTLIKPHYRDLIARVKGRWPHLKFYLHSHGQIMDLVPDLIECGVDVLNPILPLDHMDPARLKREFGGDLCFHGGIDIEHIVPFGTVDQVRRHVREVLDVLAPGGGYWLKLQAISPMIPPDNIIAAYECAREYGRYDR
jgi:uroporphyrinogen decarboxylase